MFQRVMRVNCSGRLVRQVTDDTVDKRLVCRVPCRVQMRLQGPDFKKIIRIQKSIELLNNGYLKNSTFDSLANETGFSSYSSFYKSFKNNIGKSPQEYFLNSISK